MGPEKPRREDDVIAVAWKDLAESSALDAMRANALTRSDALIVALPETASVQAYWYPAAPWSGFLGRKARVEMGRAFLNRSAESIRVAGRAAFESGNVALLRDAVSELSEFRKTGEARRVIDDLAPLLEKLQRGATEPRESDNGGEPLRQWLSGIKAVARRYTRQSDGSCCVYLVLLRGPQAPDDFGIYVGQTAISAEERFLQHKSGYRSRPKVRKWGVRLLRPIFNHLEGMSRDEAKSIEAQLADALKRAGYDWVEGGH